MQEEDLHRSSPIPAGKDSLWSIDDVAAATSAWSLRNTREDHSHLRQLKHIKNHDTLAIAYPPVANYSVTWANVTNATGTYLLVDLDQGKCSVSNQLFAALGFVFFGLGFPFVFYLFVHNAAKTDGVESPFRQQQLGWLTAGYTLNWSPVNML